MCSGQAIPPDAARFLGAALRAWLVEGGDLERDHLQVKAIAGSHLTPAALAAKLAAAAVFGIGDDNPEGSSRGEQISAAADTVAP